MEAGSLDVVTKVTGVRLAREESMTSEGALGHATFQGQAEEPGEGAVKTGRKVGKHQETSGCLENKGGTRDGWAVCQCCGEGKQEGSADRWAGAQVRMWPESSRGSDSTPACS